MDDILQQLEQHYVQTGPSLLGYFRRRVPATVAADDLLQETFVRAYRHRDRLREASSVRAYLFGIARHVSLDALRRLRRHEELPDEIGAEAGSAEDPRLARLRRAIAKLPPAHREPLQLKLQDELSYEEIATVLELPVGTVRSRLHYAVARLREALQRPASGDGTTTPFSHET